MKHWLRLPKYRVWRYMIYGVASAVVLIMMATIIWLDSMDLQTMLILRGCTGVLGIIFVVICAIYCYVAYRDYIRHRFGPRGK